MGNRCREFDHPLPLRERVASAISAFTRIFDALCEHEPGEGPRGDRTLTRLASLGTLSLKRRG